MGTIGFINKWFRAATDLKFNEQYYGDVYKIDELTSNKKIVKLICEELEEKEFLNTPYWTFIKSIKLEDFHRRCECCGVTEPLEIHYLTKKIRGEEYSNLDKLVVLCKECHQKVHEYKKDISKLESDRERQREVEGKILEVVDKTEL